MNRLFPWSVTARIASALLAWRLALTAAPEQGGRVLQLRRYAADARNACVRVSNSANSERVAAVLGSEVKTRSSFGERDARASRSSALIA